jgi:hypothetical protein
LIFFLLPFSLALLRRSGYAKGKGEGEGRRGREKGKGDEGELNSKL